MVSSINTSEYLTAAAAKSLQSCPTLCDPIDSNPLGSSVPGILQARTLEWVAIYFSTAWRWKVKGKSLSRAWLLAIPWTVAHQAPLSMGFSRREYWGGVPLPSPIFNRRRLKKDVITMTLSFWTKLAASLYYCLIPRLCSILPDFL